MNYWHGNAGFAGMGCGGSCGCRKCRETSLGYSETYERDEPESEPAEPTPGETNGFGYPRWRLGEAAPATPAIPVFSLQCNTCHRPIPFPPQCREELRRLILHACGLAARAAVRLETNPAAAARIFRDFFVDDPLRPVPAAGNRPAGKIVAERLRQAEEALRLRGTLYRCENCDAGARSEAESMGGILDAYAIAFPAKNEVWLCPDFWTLTDPYQQAGILLHEMFHLRFFPMFKHGPMETKGTSAYCYEGFALQVDGHAPEAIVRFKCQSARLH
jgi:hypothetical protein